MAELYTVVDIIERPNISRLGKVEKLYRVTAKTGTGTIFTVEIPEADFTKEKVDQILKEKAALFEEIKKL